MNPTDYPEINKILEEILSEIKVVLGNKLIAFYLEGSLVLGDFDENVSDIDLVAVLSSEVDSSEFKKLKKMHTDFVKKHREWNDRIEVCYITSPALSKVKSESHSVVNISPGEPIHKVKTKKEWIMNWYLTREKSITLFGQSAKDIIEPISKDEFINSVKDHVRSWSNWVENMRERNGQAAYTVLTLCRALYAYKNGDQVSKKQAANWAKEKYPQWSNIIDQAVKWREEKNNNKVDEPTYEQMVNMVNFTKKEILSN